MSSISGITDAINDILGVVNTGAGIYKTLKGPGVLPAMAPSAPVPGVVTFGAEPSPATVVEDPLGAFVAVGGRFRKAWQDFESLGVQPYDVISVGQPDDRELAKLLLTRGVIPADSDLARLLLARGARIRDARVKLSNGQTITMKVVPIGPRSSSRRGVNWDTPAKRRDAARTLAAAARHLRIYRKLGAAAKALERKTVRVVKEKAGRRR